MHKWFRVRVLKRSTNLRHKRCLCETEIFASSLTFFFSSSHTEYKFSTINHNSHKTLNTNNSRRIATRNSERKSSPKTSPYRPFNDRVRDATIKVRPDFTVCIPGPPFPATAAPQHETLLGTVSALTISLFLFLPKIAATQLDVAFS